MVIVKETFESKHIGQQQQQKENITYMIYNWNSDEMGVDSFPC